MVKKMYVVESSKRTMLSCSVLNAIRGVRQYHEGGRMIMRVYACYISNFVKKKSTGGPNRCKDPPSGLL
jgi:hypothetical protein